VSAGCGLLTQWTSGWIGGSGCSCCMDKLIGK
jgi:hypothetical protein